MRAKDEIIASISAYLVAREEAAEEMRGCAQDLDLI